MRSGEAKRAFSHPSSNAPRPTASRQASADPGVIARVTSSMARVSKSCLSTVSCHAAHRSKPTPTIPARTVKAAKKLRAPRSFEREHSDNELGQAIRHEAVTQPHNTLLTNRPPPTHQPPNPRPERYKNTESPTNARQVMPAAIASSEHANAPAVTRTARASKTKSKENGKPWSVEPARRVSANGRADFPWRRARTLRSRS